MPLVCVCRAVLAVFGGMEMIKSHAQENADEAAALTLYKQPAYFIQLPTPGMNIAELFHAIVVPLVRYIVRSFCFVLPRPATSAVHGGRWEI